MRLCKLTESITYDKQLLNDSMRALLASKPGAICHCTPEIRAELEKVIDLVESVLSI